MKMWSPLMLFEMKLNVRLCEARDEFLGFIIASYFLDHSIVTGILFVTNAVDRGVG